MYRRGGRLAGATSASIRVGDLVQVHDGEEVPCDLLLLRVGGAGDGGGGDGAAREAVAFLSTASLDGEPDLKPRRPRLEMQSLSLAKILSLRGAISCEPPNADLYRCDAHLAVEGEGGLGDGWALPLSADQLLQHGTIVERTGWLIGAAVCELPANSSGRPMSALLLLPSLLASPQTRAAIPR